VNSRGEQIVVSSSATGHGRPGMRGAGVETFSASVLTPLTTSPNKSPNLKLLVAQTGTGETRVRSVG
jgi:hypothetical protein